MYRALDSAAEFFPSVYNEQVCESRLSTWCPIYLQDILGVEAYPRGERLHVDGLHDLVRGTLLRRHSDSNREYSNP